MPDQNIALIRYWSREMVRKLGFMKQEIWDSELTHPQFHALCEISLHTRVCVSDIANRLQIDHSSASRLLKGMEEKGLIKSKAGRDKRVKQFFITAAGTKARTVIDQMANKKVDVALRSMPLKDKECFKQGLMSYTMALADVDTSVGVEYRLVSPNDNSFLTNAYKQILTEYGLDRPGFASHDPDYGNFFQQYSCEGAKYQIVQDHGGQILGGGGIACLNDGPQGVCELQRVFLLKKARGRGIGMELVSRCHLIAKHLGYKQIYLESHQSMVEAIKLYQKLGYQKLKAPMGHTGHHGCDCFMLKKL